MCRVVSRPLLHALRPPPNHHRLRTPSSFTYLQDTDCPNKAQPKEAMVVRIRLQRFGRHDRPFYRIVAADSRSPRDGRFIELVRTNGAVSKPAVTDRTARARCPAPSQPAPVTESTPHPKTTTTTHSSGVTTRSPLKMGSRRCASRATASSTGSASGRSHRRGACVVV